MKTKQRVGQLDGQDVYYSESNGWLIRSKHSSVLRDMSKDEVGRFMTQPLRVLGEYDYENLKGV